MTSGRRKLFDPKAVSFCPLKMPATASRKNGNGATQVSSPPDSLRASGPKNWVSTSGRSVWGWSCSWTGLRRPKRTSILPIFAWVPNGSVRSDKYAYSSRALSSPDPLSNSSPAEKMTMARA